MGFWNYLIYEDLYEFFSMEFFNFKCLCIIGVYFFRENVKVKICENIFLIIYAPVLLYIYLNIKSPNLSEVQLLFFVLFSFEVFSIINVIKLFKRIV